MEESVEEEEEGSRAYGGVSGGRSFGIRWGLPPLSRVNPASVARSNGQRGIVYERKRERGPLPLSSFREVPMNFATLNKKWFHEVNISVTIPSPTQSRARTQPPTTTTATATTATATTTTSGIGRTTSTTTTTTTTTKRIHDPDVDTRGRWTREDAHERGETRA